MKAMQLGWQLVTAPSKAFEAFRKPGSALYEAAALYAAFVVSYAAFYSTKPVDFPSMMQNAGLEPRGFIFWLGVGLLGTLLYAGWFVALAGFLGIAREGRMILKILAQLAVLALGAASLGLYAKGRIPALALLAVWGALVGGATAVMRRAPLPWKSVLALLLAVNVFSILSFVPLAAAASVRNETVYMTTQFLFLFWMLGVATSGLRRLTDVSLARCFISLCLSFVVTILLLFSLHLTGLVPPELIKASMAI